MPGPHKGISTQPLNNITQNQDTNPPTEINRPRIDYKTRYPNLKPKSKAVHTYN